MSSNFANISLYIPHVFASISKKRIINTFEDLQIGNVKRIDFVYKKSHSEYNAVYIHFNYWYDNIAARNFQERVINPNVEARIVYDEPWFWIVLENKTKKAPSGRKPRLNMETLNKMETLNNCDSLNNCESTPVKKQMTNRDFANLMNTVTEFTPSSNDSPAVITLDEVLEENKKLKYLVGEYIAKEGKLSHEHNMLMDDFISVKNQLALLKEEKMYNNV